MERLAKPSKNVRRGPKVCGRIEESPLAAKYDERLLWDIMFLTAAAMCRRHQPFSNPPLRNIERMVKSHNVQFQALKLKGNWKDVHGGSDRQQAGIALIERSLCGQSGLLFAAPTVVQEAGL